MAKYSSKTVPPPNRAEQVKAAAATGGKLRCGWVAIPIRAARAFYGHASVEAMTMDGHYLARAGARAGGQFDEEAETTAVTVVVANVGDFKTEKGQKDACLAAHGCYFVPEDQLGRILLAWCIPVDLIDDVAAAVAEGDLERPKLLKGSVGSSRRLGVDVIQPSGPTCDGIPSYTTGWPDDAVTAWDQTPVALIHRFPWDVIAELWMGQIAERRMAPVFGETMESVLDTWQHEGHADCRLWTKEGDTDGLRRWMVEGNLECVKVTYRK